MNGQMRYPQHLLKLIDVLKKLPGVGNKSAERFAFQLLNWPSDQLSAMSDIIAEIPHRLKQCDECGCLIGIENCFFCSPERYATHSICVIASPRDAFSIEETREFKGLYHVLDGVLSPLDGIGTDKLKLGKLKQRIEEHNIREVIIALDSTLEGDATSLYIKQELDLLNLSVTRLAFGLPMGSALDYVDGGTLARAFSARARF
jgi:recombination protein RecR